MALHLRFRNTRAAVKSIFGAIGLPWNVPLWADVPINTAEFACLCTWVSNSVIAVNLRSPDFSAARDSGLVEPAHAFVGVQIGVYENRVERRGVGLHQRLHPSVLDIQDGLHRIFGHLFRPICHLR